MYHINPLFCKDSTQLFPFLLKAVKPQLIIYFMSRLFKLVLPDCLPTAHDVQSGLTPTDKRTGMEQERAAELRERAKVGGLLISDNT